MKKIYAAEYNSKSGKDLGFDTLMMADFDLEKVMNRAESDWRRYTTRREKTQDAAAARRGGVRTGKIC